MYIFETIHGSRLYGLDHAESDYDFYRVLRFGVSRRTKHLIAGTDDTLTLTFPKFMQLASEGRPQALEAMFSAIPTTDEIPHLRSAFRPSQSAVIDAYARTIRSFAFSNTYKKRRHALRLTHNLNEFLDKGWFNPTLSESTRAQIDEDAMTEDIAFLVTLASRSTLDLFDFTDLTAIKFGVY